MCTFAVLAELKCNNLLMFSFASLMFYLNRVFEIRVIKVSAFKYLSRQFNKYEIKLFNFFLPQRQELNQRTTFTLLCLALKSTWFEISQQKCLWHIFYSCSAEQPLEELLKHARDRSEEMFFYSRKGTRKGLYLDQLLSTTNLVEENIGNCSETV